MQPRNLFKTYPRCILILLLMGSILIGAPMMSEALPAFPGAEGFGSHTPGGRGGRIIEVTNLKDSGPGSLRHALSIEEGPRIVIFRVSGTINLSHDIWIQEKNSYLTVAGQTAPGDGIQLKNWTINIANGAHDIVIRHLRFRPGGGGVTYDANGIPNGNIINGLLLYGRPKPVYNIVIDHSTVMWSVDENGEMWGNVHDITFQWSIFAEGGAGVHPSGEHSMGFLSGGNSVTQTMSLHHNLFAHNSGRNPGFIYYYYTPGKPQLVSICAIMSSTTGRIAHLTLHYLIAMVLLALPI